MKGFKGVKMRTKLIASFVILVVFIGIVGFVGIRNMQGLKNGQDEMYQQRMVPTTVVATMQENTLLNNRDLVLLLYTKNRRIV